MQWGTEQEPLARTIYEFMTDAAVTKIGVVMHPSIDMACASADGLVGSHGLVEIKCPNTATHIETLLGSGIDGRYIKQKQWQMTCTGANWCDFVSFDPRMPADMQIHIQRIERDAVMIADLEQAAQSFLAEVDATVAKLVGKFRTQEAAE